MPALSAESTAPCDVPKGPPTADFVPGKSAARVMFDEELRRLLRSRLILIHLLALAFTMLLAILVRLVRPGEHEALVQVRAAGFLL